MENCLQRRWNKCIDYACTTAIFTAVCRTNKNWCFERTWPSRVVVNCARTKKMWKKEREKTKCFNARACVYLYACAKKQRSLNQSSIDGSALPSLSHCSQFWWVDGEEYGVPQKHVFAIPLCNSLLSMSFKCGITIHFSALYTYLYSNHKQCYNVLLYSTFKSSKVL